MDVTNTSQRIKSEAFPQLFNDNINGIAALLIGCYNDIEGLAVKYLFTYKNECVIIEIKPPNYMEMEIFERVKSLLSVSEYVTYTILKNDALFKMYNSISFVPYRDLKDM